MTCRQVGDVIICGPPPGVYIRRIAVCGECKRRHRFIVQWDGAWYGTTSYGSCGDRWSDGEMWGRPFERGWREKAQKRFREMWENAAPKDLYRAYMMADCDMACASDDEWESAAQRRRDALAAIDAHRSAA
jgi:hypothetical protein